MQPRDDVARLTFTVLARIACLASALCAFSAMVIEPVTAVHTVAERRVVSCVIICLRSVCRDLNIVRRARSVRASSAKNIPLIRTKSHPRARISLLILYAARIHFDLYFAIFCKALDFCLLIMYNVYKYD